MIADYTYFVSMKSIKMKEIPVISITKEPSLCYYIGEKRLVEVSVGQEVGALPVNNLQL